MPCMLSKTFRPPAEQKSTFKVLPKEFIAEINTKTHRYFVTGNGPSIRIGFLAASKKDCFSGTIVRPCRFVEVSVFPLTATTVRGIIVMPHEKYIAAFGDTYLAFIHMEQIIDGGDLCRSRVLSTGRVIVGGRRIGPNKMQLFYEDGGVGKLDVKHRMTIHFAHTVKKLKLPGAGNMITCWLQHEHFQAPVLLGTAHGQVISSAGKIFFKGGHGPVRQMVVINEHLVLLLFGDRSIGLLDLRYHVIRKGSIIAGRFNAIEDEYQKDVIIVGDIDGTLHSFTVDTEKCTLKLAVSSKCEYDDAIVAMHPTDKMSLACTTAMGSMFVVSRISFMHLASVPHEISFAVRMTCSSSNKWYFMVDGHLFYSVNTANTDFVKGTKDASFYKLKHYHFTDFDLVYAYGRFDVFLDCASPFLTGKKKRRRQLITMEKEITALAVTVDYVLFQFGKDIRIYVMHQNEWAKMADFVLEEVDEVTALARIPITDKCVQFVIALRSGAVFCGTYEADKTTAPLTPLDTLDFLEHDYVVAMQSEKTTSYGRSDEHRVYLLTAKAQLMVYLLPTKGECKCKKSTCDEKYRLEEATNYRNLIGRGYDLMWIDNCPVLVGFKQNVLNVYRVGEHMQLSVATKGPRSNCILYVGVSKSSITLIYDYGPKKMIITNFPKIGRLMVSDLRHCTPITQICVLDEFACRKREEVADIATGDSKGRLVVMTVNKSDTDSKVAIYCDNQLSGAILAMHYNHGHLCVGTSSGYVYVFENIERRIYLVFRRHMGQAVTAFGDGPRCLCTSDCSFALPIFSLADGSQKSLILSMDAPTISDLPISTKRRVKWFWHIPAPKQDHLRVLSLTTNGVLNSDAANHPAFSSDTIDNPQLYSCIKFFDGDYLHLKGGDFQFALAGYHTGLFLFTLYDYQTKKYVYFLGDVLHTHEIIDCVFWIADDHKYWRIGTLDKTGLYVQRILVIDKGIQIVGTPRKWHCPVPQPKALAVLKKRNEVIVVGKGLASCVL